MQIEQAAATAAPVPLSRTWRKQCAWTLYGLIVALAIAGTILSLRVHPSDPRDLLGLLYVLASGLIGALIVGRRPNNLVGWLLLSASFCLTSGFAAIQYGLYDRLVQPGALPWPRALPWLATALTPLGTLIMVFWLPLVFSDGRLIGPRWRTLVTCMSIGVVAMIAVHTISPGNIQDTPGLPNPFAVSLPQPWNTLWPLVDSIGALAGFLLGAAGLVVRYRRSVGEERAQLKWLTYAIGAWIITVTLAIVVEPFSRTAFLVADTLIYVSLTAIPVAIGVAVLRYRLYDVDVLINRTLVYGALTVCVGTLYALLVIGLGALLGAQGAMGFLAMFLVAVIFAPLRDRLQRGVNRVLYGDRDEPYTALTRLGQRLEETVAPDDVLATLVQTIADTLRLPYAAIALYDVGRPRVVAEAGKRVGTETAPRHFPSRDRQTAATFPLTYQGETVGELRVASRSPGESFSEADRRLLRDLARQAGAAVHAVQLTTALEAGLAEVRRSRERLVMAQEDERRRIQRDLHDGLGPVLASMRLRLEACLDQAQTSAPNLVADLERLDELAGQASTDIRRLVYDLRPPVLDQLGLVAALRQHAARFTRETGIAVDFQSTLELALPAALDVTIFRIVHEALNNVQKHAHVTHVTIRLDRLGDALLLSIEDNGVGGAAEGVKEQGGTGMGSMRERAELLGGTIVLRSLPRGGTTLEVYVPLRGESSD